METTDRETKLHQFRVVLDTVLRARRDDFVGRIASPREVAYIEAALRADLAEHRRRGLRFPEFDFRVQVDRDALVVVIDA